MSTETKYEPTATVKNYHGTSELRIASSLTGKRIIFVEGTIDDDAASVFVKQLLHLAIENPTAPVKVIVSSDGGSIQAGMVIYDAITSSNLPISTYCIKAYSMGAIIFCCANHGRYILAHSKVMVHEPLIASNIVGKTSSVKAISDDLLKTKRDMDELIAKHTGKPLEEVEKITCEDHYFSAEEAVKFGLADAVIGFSDILSTERIAG